MIRCCARTSHASSAAYPAISPATQPLVGPRPVRKRHACAQCSGQRAHAYLLLPARIVMIDHFRTMIWSTEATPMSLTSGFGRKPRCQTTFSLANIQPQHSAPAKLWNRCLARKNCVNRGYHTRYHTRYATNTTRVHTHSHARARKRRAGASSQGAVRV